MLGRVGTKKFNSLKMLEGVGIKGFLQLNMLGEAGTKKLNSQKMVDGTGIE